MTKVFIFCGEIKNYLKLLAEDLSGQGVDVEISTGKAGKTAWQYKRYLSESVDKCDIIIVGFAKESKDESGFFMDVKSILEIGKPTIPVLLEENSITPIQLGQIGLRYPVINIAQEYSAGFNQILEVIKSHDHNNYQQPSPKVAIKRRVEILPKRVMGFIDREGEVKKISTLLLEKVFVQLRGLGGIGKTSLAIEIAYKLKDKFKDGVLWISALDSPSTEDLLNSIGLAFGFDVLAMPTSQKKFFLKIHLAALDYLLVIDNVQESDPIEQTYDLVANGAILCTSRPQIILPAMRIVDVDVLEKQYAIRLFQNIYGHQDPEENDKELLEDICVGKLDGYPLAIELAAKQANIQRLPVQKLYSRLDEAWINNWGLPALGSIAASLLSTIDQLPTTARELFVAMGVFTGRKMEKPAIEFVIEISDIEKMLYVLQGYSLVTIEKDQVSLHPLIKELANHLAGQNHDLYFRMVEYYVQYTNKNSKEYGVIEREKTNIEGAVIWSYMNQRYDLMTSIIDNLLGQDAYYSFWAVRGYWEQSIKLLRYGIEASRHMGDPYKEARYNLELGLFLYWLGDQKNAKMVSKNAEEIFGKLDSKQELIRTYWLQGYIEDDEDNYEMANRLYRCSLSLSESVGNKILIVTSMELVGVSEYHRGNYEVAREFLENSLQLSELERYMAGITRGQRRLAAVARIQAMRESNQEKRNLYFQESRQLLEACLRAETNRRSRARALRQLGMIDLLENRIQDAESHLNEALDLFTNLGNQRGIGATYFNLGTLHFENGNLEKAKNYYENSLEIARGFNAQMGMALNIRQLALIAKRQGLSDHAKILLDESIGLLSKINSPYLDETLRLREE